MIISLSGFAGSGKTTTISALKRLGYKVVPETARMLIPLQETVFKDSRDDLSYKSFSAYLNALHFIHENGLKQVVFDRNMLDSLVFLQMYSDQKIDLNDFQGFIHKFNESHGNDFMFDRAFLLKHTDNDEHISSRIITDKVRVYGTAGVDDYKKAASEWENCYKSIIGQLGGFARKFVEIDPFPENQNQLVDIVLSLTQ